MCGVLPPVLVPGSHPPHGMFALEVGLGKRLPLGPFHSTPRAALPVSGLSQRCFAPLQLDVRLTGPQRVLPGEQLRKSLEKAHWMKGAWLQAERVGQTPRNSVLVVRMDFCC